MSRKYKLFDKLCNLNLEERTIRALILNNNYNEIKKYVEFRRLVYEIEFSEEELKKLKNFVIFEDFNDEFIVIPVGLDKEIIEKIIQSNNLIFLEFYYNLLKKIINNNNKKLKHLKFTKKNLLIKYWLTDIEFFANIFIVKEHLIKYLNNFVIKNKKIPSMAEVKEELIRFLNSYNIIEQIEMYLNKSKLLNII
ncbi:MAG: hypothetical protein QW648_02855 [Nanoarchaeales archaeon]